MSNSISECTRVPFLLEEPTGVRRERWPICWGVPFPQGALGSAENVRLLDPDGGEIPCAIRETGRWPDGSVKWILLQFQVSVGPQERATYTVEFGTGVVRAEFDSPLTVSDAEGEILVETGPLRFAVSKRRFALLDQVWFEETPMLRPGDAQRVWLTTPEGGTYRMAEDPSPSVAVEETTSQRVVLRATGRHLSDDGDKLFDYLVRIYAYAGLPRIDIEYTFVNTEDEEYTEVKEIALRTGVRLKGQPVGLCGAGKKLYESSEPFYSYHKDVMIGYGVFQGSPIYLADGTPAEGVGMYEQQIARGWMDLSDGERGVAVCMRDFVVNYPKKASVGKNEIVFHFWPSDAETLEFHRGMSKTNALTFLFHRGSGRGARVHEIGAAVEEPITPWNGSWYLESKAFGDVFPHSPKRYPKTEAALRDLALGHRDRRALGVVDYGDYVAGAGGHRSYFANNNEHDIPHGLLLQYLRDGEYLAYHVAESGIWHTMDIDIVHHTSRSPLELGGWRIHGRGHVQYDPEGFPDVSVAPSHMWTESLIEYYYLTGHPRALACARGVADCFVGLIEEGWATPPYHSEWHSSRDSGWPLIGLAAVYEATGEERYLDAMTTVARALAAAQRENGGWPIVLRFNEGYCPFQMGIALTGLMRYHQVTGDEEIEQVFLKGMDFLAGDEMRFADGTWIYVTSPEYRGSYYSSTPLEPFGYAYELTKNPWYIRQGLIHHGRSFDLRASLRFLYWVDRARVLRDI